MSKWRYQNLRWLTKILFGEFKLYELGLFPKGKYSSGLNSVVFNKSG